MITVIFSAASKKHYLLLKGSFNTFLIFSVSFNGLCVPFTDHYNLCWMEKCIVGFCTSQTVRGFSCPFPRMKT